MPFTEEWRASDAKHHQEYLDRVNAGKSNSSSSSGTSYTYKSSGSSSYSSGGSKTNLKEEVGYYDNPYDFEDDWGDHFDNYGDAVDFWDDNY